MAATTDVLGEMISNYKNLREHLEDLLPNGVVGKHVVALQKSVTGQNAEYVIHVNNLFQQVAPLIEALIELENLLAQLNQQANLAAEPDFYQRLESAFQSVCERGIEFEKARNELGLVTGWNEAKPLFDPIQAKTKDRLGLDGIWIEPMQTIPRFVLHMERLIKADEYKSDRSIQENLGKLEAIVKDRGQQLNAIIKENTAFRGPVTLTASGFSDADPKMSSKDKRKSLYGTISRNFRQQAALQLENAILSLPESLHFQGWDVVPSHHEKQKIFVIKNKENEPVYKFILEGDQLRIEESVPHRKLPAQQREAIEWGQLQTMYEIVNQLRFMTPGTAPFVVEVAAETAATADFLNYLAETDGNLARSAQDAQKQIYFKKQGGMDLPDQPKDPKTISVKKREEKAKSDELNRSNAERGKSYIDYQKTAEGIVQRAVIAPEIKVTTSEGSSASSPSSSPESDKRRSWGTWSRGSSKRSSVASTLSGGSTSGYSSRSSSDEPSPDEKQQKRRSVMEAFGTLRKKKPVTPPGDEGVGPEHKPGGSPNR